MVDIGTILFVQNAARHHINYIALKRQTIGNVIPV
jgi:hypothetical protein